MGLQGVTTCFASTATIYEHKQDISKLSPANITKNSPEDSAAKYETNLPLHGVHIEHSFEQYYNETEITDSHLSDLDCHNESKRVSRRNSQDSLFSSVSSTRRPSPKLYAEMKRNAPLSKDVKVERLQWDSDVAYPVIVTSVVSPWEYHLQLINPDNTIMEQLCMEFMKEAANGYKGGLSCVPAIGTFCCAKSQTDDTWYRAEVVEVVDESTARVLFIDEGFESIINKADMRPLDEKFTAFSCQSFKCILGGIQPTDAFCDERTLSFDDCNQLWSSQSFEWIVNLLEKTQNILIAYLYYPPNQSYRPPHNLNRDLLVCDLYLNQMESDVQWGQMSSVRPVINDHLAFLLVSQGFAGTCPYFSSELNRKKSQKILSHVMEEKDIDKSVSNREGDLLNKDTPNCKQATSSVSTKSYNKTNSEIECKSNLSNLTTSQDHKELVNKKKRNKKTSSSSFSSSKVVKEENIIHAQPDEKVVVNAQQEQSSGRNLNSRSVPFKEINKESKNEYTFAKDFKETKFVTETEGFAKVIVSEVISPGLFYVHLLTPEVAMLDTLMQELNIFYKEEYESIKALGEQIEYKEGDPIAARFSGDLKWYRAVIVSVLDTEYDILYVDFGSIEKLSKFEILPLSQKFADLPQTTIPCCLADVAPLSSLVSKPQACSLETPGGSEFSKKDSLMFDSASITLTWSERVIVRSKELLLAHNKALLASLKSQDKNKDGLYEIYIYDTSGDKDVFINQVLVNDGLVASQLFCKEVEQITITEEEFDNDLAALKSDSLSSWDPMKEQYLSKRNSYSVNVDDVAVATLGFVDNGKNICYNFKRRGYCYRGNDCKFLHGSLDSAFANSVETFCANTNVDLPEEGDWVAVSVTALFDPTHIWITFPYGIELFNLNREPDEDSSRNYADRTIKDLSQLMNEYYSHGDRSTKTDLTLFAAGEFVAAKFEEDQSWYRARVINAAEDLLQISYVDFGNTDVVSEENVRHLIPDFFHFPFQAVECFLEGVTVDKAVRKNVEMNEKLRNLFRNLTSDKALVAQVKSRSANNTLNIELYDTSVTPNLFINREIKKWPGIQRVDIKQVKPTSRQTSHQQLQMIPA